MKPPFLSVGSLTLRQPAGTGPLYNLTAGLFRWRITGSVHFFKGIVPPNFIDRAGPFGQYVAAVAIAALAVLVVEDLSSEFYWLKYVSFATAVCWSFARLRTGPAACTLFVATIATDYFVTEPVYSLDLNGWTILTLTCYFLLGLLMLRFGNPRRGTT